MVWKYKNSFFSFFISHIWKLWPQITHCSGPHHLQYFKGDLVYHWCTKWILDLHPALLGQIQARTSITWKKYDTDWLMLKLSSLTQYTSKWKCWSIRCIYTSVCVLPLSTQCRRSVCNVQSLSPPVSHVELKWMYCEMLMDCACTLTYCRPLSRANMSPSLHQRRVEPSLFSLPTAPTELILYQIWDLNSAQANVIIDDNS